MNNEKLRCCERCQIFWTCETKWYRGERNEENICCAACNFYRGCLERQKEKADKARDRK